MAKIVGNDISEWQGQVDWNTYKNNTNFVIIRATIGTSRVDKQFVKNRDSARAANLPLGFYHYSYPQFNTPEAEADYCVAQLADIKSGEIIVLDFEEAWGGDHVDFCKRFLDRVSSKLNGYKPLIYLNQAQLKAKDWKPVAAAGYGLWVAAYTYDPNNNTFFSGPWAVVAMQQWTSSQKIPGISGNVDGNVFFGDAETFRKYGYRGTPPPVPAVDYEKKYKDEVVVTDSLRVKVADLEKRLNKVKEFTANA